MAAMSPNSDAYSYRMEFRPMFLFTYNLTAIGGSLFVWLWARYSASAGDIPTHVILETIGYVAVFFAPPYSALCTFIITRYFRYSISSRGIGGKNAGGSARFISWDSISSVKPIRFGNLTFIRVLTEDNKLPVWMPLFIRSERAFDDSIREHAPEGNVARTLFITSKSAN